MKRFMSIILVLMIVVISVPFSAFAAGTSPERISGTSAMVYAPSADTLVINGKSFASNGDSNVFTANVTVSDVDSSYNAFYLNGKKLADMTSGENILNIKAGDLIDGENKLGVYLGTDSATYNTDMVYGSVNLDDIVVESVRFSGIPLDKPSAIDKHLPIVGAAGTKVSRVNYADKFAIGDGWSAETKLGGSTPNTPVMCELIFEKPDMSGVFVIDTTAFGDGEYEFEFQKNGASIEKRKYIIDNSAPVISFSISDGATVTRYSGISLDITDLSSYKKTITVDGKTSGEINLSKLSAGRHTVYVTAVDELGNKTEKSLIFNLSERAYDVKQSEGDGYSFSVRGDATVYSAKLLKDIRMFENAYGTFDESHLRSSDEVLVSYNDKPTTPSVDGAYPYQSFVVNTEYADSDEVIVSYTGTTGNGVDLELKAWNYKESRWDSVAVTQSGEPVSVSLKLDDYSQKHKMRINVFPKAVYNGSDTIIWNSDTQYYSRYEDLRPYYTRINEYTVEQYKAGNIGYYVHTGDLIDRTNAGDDIANEEFSFASEAQKILDDNNVPNGVVSGNHDIRHTTADYNYYYKYFPESRYKDFDWYGGSLNNNMHHYDLVSIGEYDFAFVYIGCYKEAETDTINWVNSICKAYPDRNIVLCTHEYILPSGAYSGDRAQVMWEKMAVPNENVVMILCGHNDGVCDKWHAVEGTDRKVLEILSDYQFAENGQGPQHVENDCTCDGEGYVRLMTFTPNGQLVSTTYSPVAEDYGIDPYNYFPSYMDSFVYDLNLKKSDRSITTADFNVAVKKDSLGEVGEGTIKSSGEAFFAEITAPSGETVLSKVYVVNEFKNNYSVDKRPEYKNSTVDTAKAEGLRYVSENLHMNEENSIPSSELVEIGLNLMPESVKDLRQTSGSKTYDVDVVDGAIVISHEYNGANWVTLANAINTVVDTDKYDRVYFGVTAHKDARWNIHVNFAGHELSFSRNESLADKFGYVNTLPSDIQGTWQGYIDLSEFVSGQVRLNNIYFVTATPGMTLSFDYLFLGSSNGGKVRFITDDKVVTAKEALVGESVSLPEEPFKLGYTFDGWYTQPEGGNRVDSPVTVSEGVTEIYAHFTEKNTDARTVEYFDTEVNIERAPIGKIVVIAICILFIIAAVAVLLVKVKNTKTTAESKGE